MSEIQEIPRGQHAASLILLAQRGFVPNTFIDIGAAEGSFFIWRQQSGLYPGARHFFIDAMQENEDAYRMLAAKFGSGYEITALSCMEGETVMRVDPDFYNTHIDHLQPEAKYEGTRRVAVTMLDSVVKRHALQPPYALKLDVQGAELDVLRGALQTMRQSVVVVAEIQMFTERDSLVDLLNFMHGNGWALYDITDPGYYPSDQTLYQCYTTFIPKHLDFRRQTAWCLPDQEQAVREHLRQRRAANLRTLEALCASPPA